MNKKNIEIPYAVLLELTHRCPLSCPYCSNPLELEKKSNEIDTDTWKRVLTEAAGMGILQAHFSGGEPTARKDLEELIKHANSVGLYTNLITSGVLINEKRLKIFYDMGLDHVQVSFQDTEAENANRIAGYKGHEKKIETAKLVRKIGLPLTVNAVMHKQNLHNLETMINMAVDLDAERLEVPLNLLKASEFCHIQDSDLFFTLSKLRKFRDSAAWQGKTFPAGVILRNCLPQPPMQDFGLLA